MKDRGHTVHYRLTCRHIRLIDVTKIDVHDADLEVYCKKCDSFQKIKNRADRYEYAKD